MATDFGGTDLFRQVLTQALREHWVLFLIEGIVLVMLGVLAILVPMIATIPVPTLIGWLILISGVVGLVTTVMARDVPGFWWSLVSAVMVSSRGSYCWAGRSLKTFRSRWCWSCSSASRAWPGACMRWST